MDRPLGKPESRPVNTRQQLSASHKMPPMVGRAAPRAPFVSYPATARAERRALPAAGDKFILSYRLAQQGLKARHMIARGEAPGTTPFQLPSPVRAAQNPAPPAKLNKIARAHPSKTSTQRLPLLPKGGEGRGGVFRAQGETPSTFSVRCSMFGVPIRL